MNKNKHLILIGIFILVYTLFVINCTNDHISLPVLNETEKYDEYLSIENLVQRTAGGKTLQLNDHEKSTIYKAIDRILKSSIDEQGKVRLRSVNASILNIDDYLFALTFDFLLPYIKGEKIIGYNAVSYLPRIKTRTEGGDFGGGFVGGGGGSIDGGGGNIGGGDYGGGGSLSEADLRRWFKNHFEKDEVYQMICDQANLSVFERKCFSQYWYAKGLMILTLDEWEGISEVTDTTGYKTGVPIKRRAMKFYKKVVSFYSYAEYDYALGSSTITFTENGIPVGLRDSYDFNMFANRSLKAEAVTISMSILGKLYGGQDYEIYYGVY